MSLNRYQTHQLGIVFGPYGSIGYAGTIQREDLKEVAQTFSKLFRWAKKTIAALLQLNIKAPLKDGVLFF